MRLACLLAGLACLGGPARAAVKEAVGPIWLDAPDPGSCFAANRLRARLEHRLPGARVVSGTGEGGLAVSVARQGDLTLLTIVRRASDGPRTEQRSLPREDDCNVLLDTVVDIIARAATPLAWPVPSSDPTPDGGEPASRGAARALSAEDSVPVGAPPPAVRPSRLQVGAALRLGVSLPDGSFAPGFSLALRGRIRRWIFGVAGGVDWPGDLTLATGKLELLRTPLFAGAGYEVPVRGGAFRFELGLLVEIWTARSTGIAHPETAYVAHPGLYGALAFHLHAGRWLDVILGLDVEYAIVHEVFTLHGSSAAAATPSWWICPTVGTTLNFL